MHYDLLLAGGTLVDPAQRFHDIADVAFAGGCVVAIGRDLPRAVERTRDRGGRDAGQLGDVVDRRPRVHPLRVTR